MAEKAPASEGGRYKCCGKKLMEFGGADGVRTHDLLDAIEARSQLRHGPTDEPRNSTTRL